MKFEHLIHDLLLELSGDEIYKKYYADIEKDIFFDIASADPQTKVNGKTIIKIGKYAKVLISIYRNGKLRFEDLPKATDYLNIIYKHKIPVDIKKVETISDLYVLVKDVEDRTDITLEKILSGLDEDVEYTLDLDGKYWYIFRPLTEKAACHLGVGTEWCTTFGEHSLDPKHKGKDNNYFEHYNQTGSLYIFINKNDHTKKYQFHFEEEQLMDIDDSPVRFDDIENKGEIIRFFQEEMYHYGFETPDIVWDAMYHYPMFFDKEFVRKFYSKIDSSDDYANISESDIIFQYPQYFSKDEITRCFRKADPFEKSRMLDYFRDDIEPSAIEDFMNGDHIDAESEKDRAF